MTSAPRPVLDRISNDQDLTALTRDELKLLCAELRDELIEVVSQTGGHLGAGLGVVELTVALHATFDLPRDILIWDVGHQAYPHKMLTGRRHQMTTLRQKDGLSGFTKRSESEYDPFGAGHSSTSISAALGFAEARDALGQNHNVIAVIGDGAMSAGMAYEAMNNAGALKSRLIVILNDNDMSIAPPTGAMRSHLARIVSGEAYRSFRGVAKTVAEHLPKFLYDKAEKAEEFMRGFWTGGTLFEELGFYYVGPIDGHNLDHLLPILKNARDAPEGPILVHVVTQKGKGYAPAEEASDKYHGVSKFDLKTGVLKKGSSPLPSYTSVFADSLVKQAREDEKIVAITAAMPSGTGLDRFAAAFPERCYDVGIAEQHAVTFAAGLAAAGMKPFCAIYSTFLQRGYDQLVHDVAIQNLPVRFAIDRAGLVGADGATHAGSFDVAYLCPLPNMVVMAPSDEVELTRMVATATRYDDGPIAFRYPRGNGLGLQMDDCTKPLEIGRGRLVKDGGQDVAFLSFGTRLQPCLDAANQLETKFDVSVSVADARFAKPLDEDLIRNLVLNHRALIIVEEGASGGFGAQVLHFLSTANLLGTGCKIKTLCLPDYYQNHATQDEQYHEAGLDAPALVQVVADLKLDHMKPSLHIA